MGLIDLAKKINKKGDHFIKKNGINEFHKKASELLNAQVASQFDFQEIVEESFKVKHPHYFGQLEFSDLPITISRGTHCFIDLYFWRRRPTVIHNHHFAGAFMCLTGKNVDLEFSFKKELHLGQFHALGKLELKRQKQMVAGDITEIGFMNKFIHQNHHQSDLTVNLCFRTPQTPGKNLSHFLYSGLRYEKNPLLLGRVQRLLRFIDLGDFDLNKVEFNNDDAIHFLLQTYETRSANPRLLKTINLMNKKIKKELGLDISKLVRIHDEQMEKIESEYE